MNSVSTGSRNEHEKPNFLLRPRSTIIIQPTTLCNLNCRYCYLSQRRTKSFIDRDIVKRLAESLCDLNVPLMVAWHGGEPLACGQDRFSSYISAFDNTTKLLSHSVQTNATLINESWCKLFKNSSVSVGVSFDGSKEANMYRPFFGGGTSYLKTLSGLNHLKSFQIPFSVLSVVHNLNVDTIKFQLDHLSSFSPVWIGLNIEETVGSNVTAATTTDWRKFWVNVLSWSMDSGILVREIALMLYFMERLLNSGSNRDIFSFIEPLITISINGDVNVLSPDFMNTQSLGGKSIVVGNIAHDSIAVIMQKAASLWYVLDFAYGRSQCLIHCKYFEVCGGGRPANKWYEHHSFRSTQTNHCTNWTQALVEAILEILEDDSPPGTSLVARLSACRGKFDAFSARIKVGLAERGCPSMGF